MYLDTVKTNQKSLNTNFVSNTICPIDALP